MTNKNNQMPNTTKQNGTSSSTVARFFDNWSAANSAVDALRAAGFRDDRIGILSRDDKKVGAPSRNMNGGASIDDGMVATNAAKGAAIGGVTGLVAALVALAIPGVGPIIAGGVLATALGTTVAGTVTGVAAGGLIGALTGLGISDDDARYYDEGVRNGGTLVTVNETERYSEVARILEQHGGRQRS